MFISICENKQINMHNVNKLLANLRELKSHLTGDLLDAGCHAVRHRLGHALAKKIDSSASYSRIRTVIKNLLQIGSNLSQSREFRDLFEDILTKVLFFCSRLFECLLICCFPYYRYYRNF